MVEVTQADRKAAASVAVLVEMRELILAGRADHHAEPFARHRIAALEEAAKVADEYVAFHDKHDDGLSGFTHMALGAREVAEEIRALKGPTDEH